MDRLYHDYFTSKTTGINKVLNLNKETVRAIKKEKIFFFFFFLSQSVLSNKHSNGQYSKTRILITVENKIQIQEAITV